MCRNKNYGPQKIKMTHSLDVLKRFDAYVYLLRDLLNHINILTKLNGGDKESGKIQK